MPCKKNHIALCVNIDHVATLRQARGEESPSVLDAARVVESVNADGVTVHLREDRRHIQDHDVYAVCSQCSLPLNLEMSLDPEIVRIACDVNPEQVTIVPEKRKELTTEGGLNVMREMNKITRAVKRLQSRGIRVSLFVNASLRQIDMCAKAGVEAVELHTGEYARCFSKGRYSQELTKLHKAAERAHQHGLRVHAGHGLNYENVGTLCALPHLRELNIGHAIISHAVFTGLSEAITRMRSVMNGRGLYAKKEY